MIADLDRDLAQLEQEGRHAIAAATTIEIRTLHALARQVLLDAGEGRNLVADRLPLLRAARRRQLAADPQATLTTLMSSLGLAFEEEQLNWAGRIKHNVGGNRLRKVDAQPDMLVVYPRGKTRQPQLIGAHRPLREGVVVGGAVVDHHDLEA